MTSNTCWPWSHEWSKWELYSEKYWGESDRITGQVTEYPQPMFKNRQHRHCAKCGRVKTADLS